MGRDEFDFHPVQFGREGGKALGLSVSKAPLDDEVLSLHIAELAHPLHERVVIGVRIRRGRP